MAAALTACGRVDSDDTVQMVLEDDLSFYTANATQSVERGSDAVFEVTASVGYELTGCDYGDYELTYKDDGNYELTLKNVRYHKVVRIEAEQQQVKLTYVDELSGKSQEQISPRNHICTNTAADIFEEPGYSLVGWTSRAGGAEAEVSLGSRIDAEGDMTLYAVWQPWADEEAFEYTVDGDYVTITGVNMDILPEEILCIPAAIDGRQVIEIAEGAITGGEFDQLILPQGLRTLQKNAVQCDSLQELVMYDDIREISDYAFSGCDNLQTIRINALQAPVYTTSYYGTFADKMDYLKSIDEPKIVLFSGSSTRFGYDSPRIADEMGMPVVNMGVFAYTNALPQLDLILEHMDIGDILVHSPEFDTAKRQFCSDNTMDDSFWAMVEANYDLVSELDIRNYAGVFSSFSEYNKNRKGMTACSYADTPACFDEDGNAVETPSYNRQGDYIVYRPDADSDDAVYGLLVDYTADAFSEAAFIEPINAEYQKFLDKSVKVFFTYAPRNSQCISEESNAEALAQLDEYFSQELIVPVLGTVEESLYQGHYMSGTDNHLSTKGVQIRTDRFIEELEASLKNVNDEELLEGL